MGCPKQFGGGEVIDQSTIMNLMKAQRHPAVNNILSKKKKPIFLFFLKTFVAFFFFFEKAQT